MDSLSAILDEQNKVLESNGKLAVLWVAALVLIGVVASAVLYAIPATAQLQDLAKIGPGIVTTAISSIQFRTIAISRERSAFFRNLRIQLESAEKLPADQREVIVKLALDTIREFSKGI